MPRPQSLYRTLYDFAASILYDPIAQRLRRVGDKDSEKRRFYSNLEKGVLSYRSDK